MAPATKGVNVNTFDYGDVVFHTFAVGPNATCELDPTGRVA
ncbi:unnamed protein product [marine sediment metagenome]|uniref:Uncharacterized protein n=1 Tax=marine sediment metagenome TaxID=412755 RepID=X1N5V9_9ZZZZ